MYIKVGCGMNQSYQICFFQYYMEFFFGWEEVETAVLFAVQLQEEFLRSCNAHIPHLQVGLDNNNPFLLIVGGC